MRAAGCGASTARISARTRSGSNQMCSGMYRSTAKPLSVEALFRPRSRRMASRLEWNAKPSTSTIRNPR